MCLKYFVFSQFGDQKHVRKIFARALMTNTDSPETIGNEWIRYETLYGDLQNLLNCKEKYKTKYDIIVLNYRNNTLNVNNY